MTTNIKYRTGSTQDRQSELANFSYDETARCCLRRKDKEVGSLRSTDGYWQVYFRAKGYELAHRVVWMLHYGEIPEGYEIDHIDRDRNNNKADNLRLCLRAQNNRNTTRAARKLPKGIFQTVDRGRALLVAVVIFEGKRYTKQSKDISFLEQWIKKKREELHKEFTCHD